MIKMAQVENFENLISAKPDSSAPLITIYSSLRSPRLQYACHFIFNRILQVNFVIETDRQKFDVVKGPGINYSEEQSMTGLQISPDKLIFEKGISEHLPNPLIKDNQICFFETNTNTDFSFDIFSAVFYFISRYEEYQSYDKEMHGRFEAKQSVLFKNNFHLRPVVDHWIIQLEEALCKVYPDLKFPARNFRIVSTLDVDNLFAYRHKGFFRTLGASVKDLLRADFTNLKLRFSVLSGRSQDPFDVYEEVSDFCRSENIPLAWFFLFKSSTKYDRTVSPSSNAFNKVFEVIKKNNSQIGLHPSYNSAFSPGMLAQELHDFKMKSKSEVLFSRQHYLRFDIRTTPQLLLKNGIRADFTMGFASSPGFRAGTSHPFPFYDFEKEQSTELIFFPFCAMDGAYFVYGKITPEEALKSLMELAAEVQKVKGIFTSVFHERTFSNHLYPGFVTLYKKLHLKLKEL
jgi:hypothetical protein